MLKYLESQVKIFGVSCKNIWSLMLEYLESRVKIFGVLSKNIWNPRYKYFEFHVKIFGILGKKYLSHTFYSGFHGQVLGMPSWSGNCDFVGKNIFLA